MSQHQHAMSEEQIREHLTRMFESLPGDIPVILFAEPGVNDAYTDAAHQVIRMFKQFTGKVKVREYDLSHELAKKWAVTASPTLLFDPDRYNIRWLGAPVGEEGRMFLEALMLVGHGQSRLSDQAQKVIERIDTPRAVKVFVSPTCPYCPQQAINALKAAVHNPDLISLEIVDTQANPKLAEQYEAHSVPLTYANEVMIAQGAQSEELFAASLDQMEQQTLFMPDDDAEEVTTDVLIAGGGPAGLSAGIYAARAGMKTLVVEKGMLGGQVAITPSVENYPGLNQVGGKTLVDIMVSHALEYVNIFPGEEILDIAPGYPLNVQTSRRRIIAKTLLLATGARHRTLDIPGESRLSGHGVSYCSTCDGPMFKGRKVILVGGGNSAATEALHLANIGVAVTLVHRRDKLRAQDVLVKALEDQGVPILYNTQVIEILGDKKVTAVKLLDNKANKTGTVEVGGVFVAIGYEPNVDLARKLGVELTEEGYIAHNGHRTNVPGVYVAGDVAGGFKQIVIAAGQGAAAAMTIFEDLINPYWTKSEGESK